MSEMNQLAALYLQLQELGDKKNASKVKQLVEKLQNHEFVIAFCGHFSAGKSTMMNYFMGKEVLPSSPIPTSANLVKIKKGKNYARVYYKDANPVEFPAPYDYEVVKNFCKDGQTIESIEISDDEIHLPTGVSIMDTPGIDSTDDAHRISTESVLHLADVVLYVMDYNHVQSEVNFTFTKTLKEREKPVYVIINMIDKHSEEELSFEDYKNSVIDAFQNWGVSIDGMFFTSLRDLQHPQNEYAKLEQFLKNTFAKKEELLVKSLRKSAKYLIEDHLQYFDHQQAPKKQHLESLLADLPVDQRKKVFHQVMELEEKKKLLQHKQVHMKDQFENGINKILENAYLMPAVTRDLARQFIESQQADFKVGFLFTKKKTEEERARRLQAFYESFKKQLSAQLDWHMKDFTVKYFKENKVDSADFINNIYEKLTVDFEPTLLQNLVKKGAGWTGEYILNYTEDVSNELKRLYKIRALDTFAEGSELLQETLNEERVNLENELASYSQYKQAIDGLHKLQEEKNQLKATLIQTLTNPLSSSMLEKVETWLREIDSSTSSIEVRQMKKQKLRQEEKQIITPNDKQEQELSPLHKVQEDFNVQARLKDMVEKLQISVSALQGIKGMQTLANDMAQKAKRLSDQRFTVALFGAFSAGKSSFANALIGDKLLPVSPNPTTATINKIVPPTLERPHGTVLVKMKTKEQIFEDIQQSLSLFQKKASTLEEAIQVIQLLTYDGNDPKEKPHYSFLKAVQAGYHAIAARVGQLLTVDLDVFEEYVAKEEKSCFVEWIELYFDCPLTKQGITLVDTPGADSINARHTGVAFEYIKNADAILFVTYYNHAFSRADSEFLIQLGRVKEAFEMDKMFFIVNAADLAKSDEELKIVVDYVGEELKKFGIRFPRIFPLSSKLGLEEKLQKEKPSTTISKLSIFENAFQSFIMHDLVDLSIQSAQEDLKRSVTSLEYLLETAKEDDEVKQQKKVNGEKTKTSITEHLKAREFKVEEQSLEKEIEELLFYVVQRSLFRFHDFYNEAFNPSSLREDGRNMKQALRRCLDELLGSISFDLVQELQATSLRIENHINTLLKEVHKSVEKMIHSLHPIPLLPLEAKRFDTLHFEAAFENISKEHFYNALSIFKNSKAFFEQGGKAKLKETLQQILKEPIDSYIAEQKEYLKSVYHSYLLQALAEVMEEIECEVNDYYDGYFAALAETIDIHKIEKVKENIQSISNVASHHV